ncbi:hypothetical protein GDO78_000942 [Eleutherodactylus coqui]|uniref:RecA family profile 1 domain-containing protein n=1 Tax=Eleutherodactylus coqui TaxID=57060 RepID=A0A8J6KH18_ELECQ|nr:hypothetical protein GDO78_000942 [Eleutherodactylus coqui]
MVILREGLCPGLTADLITVLKKNHVRTVVDLVASDLEQLARKCSLSYKTLVAVRRVLLAQYSAFPSNGADLYEELKASTAILPTGNKKLDTLLDSGLYTGEVTEISGAPGSGKTQLCQSIAANVAATLHQRVCYIDTTGGLSGTRLLQLIQCKTQQEDEQAATLERIQVIHVFDAYKLLDVLQGLRQSFSQQLLRSGEKLRLVVVDSVCAVVYPLLGGKQTEGDLYYLYIPRLSIKYICRQLFTKTHSSKKKLQISGAPCATKLPYMLFFYYVFRLFWKVFPTYLKKERSLNTPKCCHNLT